MGPLWLLARVAAWEDMLQNPGSQRPFKEWWLNLVDFQGNQKKTNEFHPFDQFHLPQLKFATPPFPNHESSKMFSQVSTCSLANRGPHHHLDHKALLEVVVSFPYESKKMSCSWLVHLPWEVPIKGCSNKIIGYHFLSKIGRIQVHEAGKTWNPEILTQNVEPPNRRILSPSTGTTTIILQGLNGLCWFSFIVYHIGWGCQFTQAVHSFIWLFMNIATQLSTQQELVG